jgi:hypothetical protein
MNHSILYKIAGVAGIILLAGSVAQAVVQDIQANVTAEVQEIYSGSILNSDRAFDQLDLTQHNLPLIAEARLLPPDAGQTTEVSDVAAVATTRFSDPRLEQSSSPNEFALSAIGFSNSETSNVTGLSLAVEKRQIVFQADEVGIATGTAVTARSHFFLDGILILIARPGMTGLTGARTELDLKVTQTRTGDAAGSATVLEAAVVLTGNADGTATLTVNGALVADDVFTFGLSGVPTTGGTFQAAVLSNLSIPYEYPASIDETFNLQAEITARFESAPGTGGAVILGDQINQLISVLQSVIGPEVISGIATGITTGLAGAQLPDVTVVAAEQDTILEVAAQNALNIPLLNGTCGLVGAESALIAAGLAMMALVVRRRL